MSTWSISHFDKNGFVICPLFRTMAKFDCMTIIMYILTSCLHSYGCQLTCNTLVLVRQVPRLLCNSHPHPPSASLLYLSTSPPLLCPHSLLLLLSHFCPFFIWRYYCCCCTFFSFSFFSCYCCCSYYACRFAYTFLPLHIFFFSFGFLFLSVLFFVLFLYTIA